MARHNKATKPHLTKKERPQAPPKKEKADPSQPQISTKEAARRAKLTAREKTEEAAEKARINAAQAAERYQETWWWKRGEENKSSLATSSDNSDTDKEASSSSDDYSREKISESSDNTSSSSSSRESTPSQESKEESERSKFFHHSIPEPKSARTIRQEERRARKKAANAKAQEKASADQQQQRAQFSAAFNLSEDWEEFLNSSAEVPNPDDKEIETYYQSLLTDLQSFKSDPEAPFPTFKKLKCVKEELGQNCKRYEVLGVCECGFKRVLRASQGEGFSKEWLRKERLGWHPDKFSGVGERMEDARERAGEIFKGFQRLLEE